MIEKLRNVITEEVQAFYLALGKDAPPIYIANANTPKVSVKLLDFDPSTPITTMVPIPFEDKAIPDCGFDNMMVVYEPATANEPAYYHEFWHPRRIDGQWSAELYARIDASSAGFHAPRGGADSTDTEGSRAGGSSLAAGLISPWEIALPVDIDGDGEPDAPESDPRKAKIEHALAAGYQDIRAPIRSPEGRILHKMVWDPFTGTDGQSAADFAIPMGARIQLDLTGLNLDDPNLGLEHPEEKIIARAMSDYGIFIVDTAGGFSVGGVHYYSFFLNPYRQPDDELNLLKGFPGFMGVLPQFVERLRILDGYQRVTAIPNFFKFDPYRGQVGPTGGGIVVMEKITRNPGETAGDLLKDCSGGGIPGAQILCLESKLLTTLTLKATPIPLDPLGIQTYFSGWDPPEKCREAPPNKRCTFPIWGREAVAATFTTIAPPDRESKVTVPNAGDGKEVTLATEGTPLLDVNALSPLDMKFKDNPPDEKYVFPLGIFEFRAADLPLGGRTKVTISLPEGVTPTTNWQYLKFGPEPGKPTPHWYDFRNDNVTETGPETGAKFVSDRIILYLADGKRGDDVLVDENGQTLFDGQVVEPGGPAFINQPPQAEAGPPQTVECIGPDGATVTLDATRSSDPENDPLTYSWTGPFGLVQGATSPVTLPVGSHEITLVADDGRGGSDSDTVIITVEDTQAPTISSLTADPNQLWPPNKKLVPVMLEVDVSDVCDSAPNCHIVGLSSNEPEKKGKSSKKRKYSKKRPDWEVTGDLTVKLRAERNPKMKKRVYTIEVECLDASRNTTRETVEVSVPHDQGKNKKKASKKKK